MATLYSFPLGYPIVLGNQCVWSPFMPCRVYERKSSITDMKSSDQAPKVTVWLFSSKNLTDFD